MPGTYSRHLLSGSDQALTGAKALGITVWENFSIVCYRLGGELRTRSFGMFEIFKLASPYLETAYATSMWGPPLLLGGACIPYTQLICDLRVSLVTGSQHSMGDRYPTITTNDVVISQQNTYTSYVGMMDDTRYKHLCVNLSYVLCIPQEHMSRTTTESAR